MGVRRRSRGAAVPATGTTQQTVTRYFPATKARRSGEVPAKRQKVCVAGAAERRLRALEQSFHQSFDPRSERETSEPTATTEEGSQPGPVGRGMELENMVAFCEARTKAQQGGIMYVSGQPGIGKTLTMRSLLNRVNTKAYAQVPINGMSVTNAASLAAQISLGLAPQLSKATAHNRKRGSILHHHLLRTHIRNRQLLLVIDEMDVLVQKMPAIVHTILDWACQPGSRLVVIGIANTLNLLQTISASSSSTNLTNLLQGALSSPKAASATQLARTNENMVFAVHFRSYTASQLQSIVRERVELALAVVGAAEGEAHDGTAAKTAFPEPAIRFVAARVASQCGDARRALDVCRRATATVRSAGGTGGVTVGAVKAAFTRVQATAPATPATPTSRASPWSKASPTTPFATTTATTTATTATINVTTTPPRPTPTTGSVATRVNGLPQHAGFLLCALASSHLPKGIDPGDTLTPTQMRTAYVSFCRRHTLPAESHTGPLIGLLEGAALLLLSDRRKTGGGGDGKKRKGSVKARTTETRYVLGTDIDDVKRALTENGCRYRRFVK